MLGQETQTRRLAGSRPHARLARAHDGLGPVGDIQLIEDAIDVIANGFWAYRQLACDRCIVEAASDQFEDLTLALRKFGEHRRFGSLGPTWAVNDAGDLGQELFPRRLVLQQDVIAALQRNEFRARDRTGNDPAFPERYAGVVLSVQYQRRAADLWQQVGDVHGIKSLDQSR